MLFDPRGGFAMTVRAIEGERITRGFVMSTRIKDITQAIFVEIAEREGHIT